LNQRTAPEILKRYRPLLDSLQSSARAWAAQQAKIEAGRPAPDVAALRAAIVQRFGGSSPANDPSQLNAALPDGGDVADMAVIVILMMVQDGDQDLQEQMLEAEAQMAAKQSLRALIDEMNQVQSQMGVTPAGNQGAPCGTGYVCIPKQLLGSVVAHLNNALDSENDLSEEAAMNLQMMMDARTKLLQTASDIEKTKADAKMAILANLK
jgi:hypothetical protein